MEAAITSITTAVDFAAVVTGIGTIGAAVATVYVAYRGIKMLLSAVRS